LRILDLRNSAYFIKRKGESDSRIWLRQPRAIPQVQNPKPQFDKKYMQLIAGIYFDN